MGKKSVELELPPVVGTRVGGKIENSCQSGWLSGVCRVEKRENHWRLF